MKRRLAVPCCSVAPAPAAFGCRPASPAHGSSLSLCRGSAVRGGRGDSPPCASPRRWLPGGSLLLCCCCTCAPTRERRENERTPPSVLCSSFRPLAWRRPWRAAFWPLLAGFEARQPLLNPWQGQGRKKKPTTETTSRTTAPTSRGPRRWGGNPATPTASSGHPPTRKTDFLLALTFSARHAALLVVLAVQLALVVVVGAARATAPVADPGWVPGLVSRLDGQHEVLGEAGLLCRRR